ncbi:radial spoke RSP3 family protein, partial [bacterium]|nr:radial spoke RSP3 family protein [bacterium]
CGHPVVYHFEIHNTVTDVRECVGSDHIGAYLIIRQLISLGHQEEEITDKMIEDWLKDRVQTMKAEAWWKENGEHFKEMYNEIQELDKAVNIKDKGLRIRGTTYEYYYEPKTRATGKFGNHGYQMASITWRWDNENNGKNQLNKYGYPNDRLWGDLNLFYHTRHLHQHKLDNDRKLCKEYNDRHAEQLRLNAIATQKRKEEQLRRQREWEAGAEDRRLAEIEQEKRVERQRRIRQRKAVARAKEIMEESSEVFDNMCDYYGIRPFDTEGDYRSHEMRSLATMKQMIIEGSTLSSTQLQTLKGILEG